MVWWGGCSEKVVASAPSTPVLVADAVGWATPVALETALDIFAPSLGALLIKVRIRSRCGLAVRAADASCSNNDEFGGGSLVSLVDESPWRSIEPIGAIKG